MDVKHGQGVYITHLCEKYEGNNINKIGNLFIITPF